MKPILLTMNFIGIQLCENKDFSITKNFKRSPKKIEIFNNFKFKKMYFCFFFLKNYRRKLKFWLNIYFSVFRRNTFFFFFKYYFQVIHKN